MASDLQQLAELLKPHGFRLAYENWCWATYCPTWSDVWEVVKLADRENIGLCLDTFQIAGSEWADPTTEDGLIKHDGAEGQAKLEKEFRESLHRLATTVPKEKIFFFQISDAYKPELSLENKTLDDLKPRGRWSHSYRPFPFQAGYFPVV